MLPSTAPPINNTYLSKMASPSTSTSTTLDYDPFETVEPLRGRGKGRRGRSSRSRAVRVRGTGRGCRGKRTQRGDRIDEERRNILEELREERKRKAHEMVDSLSEEGAKKILKEAAEKIPALLLDVAEELSSAEAPGSDPDDVMPAASPSWCVCTHCRDMPTDREKVCCGMRPDLCSAIQPEMELYILEPLAIQINQAYRNDIFARHAQTEEDLQKSRRYTAYRLWILHEYGRLGRGDRRIVPSCVTWVVRDKYPDPHGAYVGFIPSW